ncbi:nucleoside-triphosphatase-like [Prosopis cineraria]|uniref:nucleoside-triphosphatase-like n=1 Tax=Prosopis cineraria TaxID=364024 RepID=UPI0024106228|nr:nucleoside-triphosphatase-like [Prosopis cineraria]
MQWRVGVWIWCVVAVGTASWCDGDEFTHRKLGALHPKSTSNISSSNSSYAVILDSGSTGTRLHVFHFNQSLNLLYIGDDFEYYYKVTPGLSSYSSNPEEAAESVMPLLTKAESVIPEESRSVTPLRLGATAGLRSLDTNTSELILQAVRDVVKSNTSFELESDDAIAILSGNQEGYYLWVTVNYLLNKLGEEYPNTIGVADLGGGSVQMAYAISEDVAANAPSNAPNGDAYVTKIYLGGSLYHIYVHSYLNFGKEASRAEILNLTGDSDNPCILTGFNGTYEYEDVEYRASAPANGSSFSECRNTVLKLFDFNTTCAHKNCTFGGVWNGGGGPGQKQLYLATSFYYLAVQAGFADPNKTSSEVRLIDYKITAELACKTTYDEANTTFPLIDEDVLAYTCMDLVYQYTLLVDGFGLDPWEVVTVVNQIEYEGSYLDASWALGNAIESISSLSAFKPLMYLA